MLLFSSMTIAQGSYYSGYQKGFKSECKCLNVPSNNQALTLGSYNEGYIDGKIDGRIYLNKNESSTQYNREPYSYDKYEYFDQDYSFLEKQLQNQQSNLRSNVMRIKHNTDLIDKTISTLRENRSVHAIEERISKIYLIEQDFNTYYRALIKLNPDYSSNNVTSKILSKQNVYLKQLENLIEEVKNDYNVTVNRIKQIRNLYNSFEDKSQNVLDGWHEVYVTDEKNLCLQRKVYVRNNRITTYVNEGVPFKVWKEDQIEFSKKIFEGKTTIKLNTGGDFLIVYFLNALSNPLKTSSPPSSTGEVSFWTNFGSGTIEIFVEDQFTGKLDSYFSSATPLCGQNGTVLFINKAGMYNYVAISDGLKWNGTITINPNSCTTFKLGK